MVLEFFQPVLSALPVDGTFVLLTLFVVFIIVARKVVRTVMTVVWIAVLSAIFPVVANYFLGFSFPLEVGTFVTFITLGVGLFALYMVAKIIYKILGIFEGAGKAVTKSKQDKNAEKIKKLEKHLKKKE